ncbi:MAG: hypothetical protein SGPRY_003929, partial [Prymnesium sp.]
MCVSFPRHDPLAAEARKESPPAPTPTHPPPLPSGQEAATLHEREDVLTERSSEGVATQPQPAPPAEASPSAPPDATAAPSAAAPPLQSQQFPPAPSHDTPSTNWTPPEILAADASPSLVSSNLPAPPSSLAPPLPQPVGPTIRSIGEELTHRLQPHLRGLSDSLLSMRELHGAGVPARPRDASFPALGQASAVAGCTVVPFAGSAADNSDSISTSTDAAELSLT